MPRRFLVCLLAALSCSLVTSHAQLLDYWSFNDEDLDPDLGVATLVDSWSGVGIDLDTFESGTTLNAQLGEGPGFSLTYIDLFAVFSQHRLTLTGLDFTGLSNISLSYAVRSTEAFAFGESAAVSYSLDGGTTWSGTFTLDLPTSSWALRTVNFGSALDNEGNVAIRIEHNALFEAGSVLDFDNLTVTAVPEPSSTAVALGGFLLMILAVRSRRSK